MTVQSKTKTSATSKNSARVDLNEARVMRSIDACRADFPVLDQTLYADKKLTYLDSGASCQQSLPVLRAVEEYTRCHHANVHRGVHALSQRATDLYEGVRDRVCAWIGARSREEIIFTRGTTAAINLVAQSYAACFIKAGDEILISSLEHHANIVPWQMVAKKIGAVIKVIPLDSAGDLDLQAYEKLLTSRTALVALTHISNVLGTVNPIASMIEKAHAVGAKVLIDGAQAVARVDLNMQALDCDFYAFSGHKMYAPTGIGILYAKRDLLEQMSPVEGGGDMIRKVSFQKTEYAPLPYKFEAGTPPIAAAIGLGAAIDYLSGFDWQSIARHEQSLIKMTHAALKTIPGLRLLASPKQQAAAISFLVGDVHPHDVGTILDRAGVAVRVGHHCAMPLMSLLKCPATVRVSFGIYNQKQDIDALIQAVEQVQVIFS